MQTFMPYSDFKKVAKCLDNKRLGKQRVEAWQIYNTLKKLEANPSLKIGWRNHPIVKMWKNYEHSLLFYGICMCKEWIDRGFKDTLLERFSLELEQVNNNIILTPKWVTDKELQVSHQSNLIRKLPEHYIKYFPGIENNLPYKWVI